jgi:hypothetical protein
MPDLWRTCSCCLQPPSILLLLVRCFVSCRQQRFAGVGVGCGDGERTWPVSALVSSSMTCSRAARWSGNGLFSVSASAPSGSCLSVPWAAPILSTSPLTTWKASFSPTCHSIPTLFQPVCTSISEEHSLVFGRWQCAPYHVQDCIFEAGATRVQHEALRLADFRLDC